MSLPRHCLRQFYSQLSADHPPKDGATAAPILFLHGFLGSKRENRYSSRLPAKDLSRPVYALHQLQSPSVIGHSMGAKTALALALNSPDLINDAVAVDNCPTHLPLGREFLGYLEGLAKLRDERVTSHREADKILIQYEKDLGTRKFHGRTLFLKALQSHYIPEKAFPLINSFFPSATIVDIDSGHWIVQERPEEFRRSGCSLW
ncbi:Alpha/Beta hydrolase protein [Aspergillus spectabilis]